jgi:hypothetical protein
MREFRAAVKMTALEVNAPDIRSEQRAAANYDAAALSFPYRNPSRAKPECLISAAASAAAVPFRQPALKR